MGVPGTGSLRRTIAAVLIAMTVVGVLLVGSLGVFQLSRFGDFGTEKLRAQMIAEREAKLGSLLETALTVLDEYRARVYTGQLTLEEAQQRALHCLRYMRYEGGQGYFWVHSAGNHQVLMLMHPVQTELTGREVTAMEDLSQVREVLFRGRVYRKDDEVVRSAVKPTKLFVEMNRLCAEKGGGRVEYYWPKPGEDPGVGYPKIAYVRLYPDWGWVVGTGAYVDDIDLQIAAMKKETAARVRSAVLTVVLGLAVCVVAATFAGRRLANGLVRPLDDMVGAAEVMARGDLTVVLRPDGQGEMGRLAGSLERMRRELGSLVEAVVRSGSQVSHAAGELTFQAHQTSVAAAQNAATAAEMAATVDGVARDVHELAQILAETARRAGEGRRGLERVIGVMEEVASAVAQTSASVVVLSLSIERVRFFTDTIERIADETKLLALNAAIEAARAGERGRGFSVVAHEVRKLADDACRSAREIGAVVQEVLQRMAEAAESVRNADTRASEGGRIMRDVGAALASVLDLVDEMERRARGVSVAAEQLSGAVQSVVASVEQTTAATQQVAACAKELDRVALELRERAGCFKTAA